MATLYDSYCGDEEMNRLLEKAGARISISEIYGLFYGCLAAPHYVSPSQYYPLIFGDNYAAYEKLESTGQVVSNLTTLWNLTTMWYPEEEPAAFPDISYPRTYEGTAKRLRDAYSLIDYFVKGLDLGHVAESDFSKGGFEALKTLSETGAFIHNLADMLENEGSRSNEQLEKTLKSVEQLESITSDCIAGMTVALTEAREREEAKLNMLHDPDLEVPADAPCPCGSGKKYKRCCGMVH